MAKKRASLFFLPQLILQLSYQFLPSPIKLAAQLIQAHPAVLQPSSTPLITKSITTATIASATPAREPTTSIIIAKPTPSKWPYLFSELKVKPLPQAVGSLIPAVICSLLTIVAELNLKLTRSEKIIECGRPKELDGQHVYQKGCWLRIQSFQCRKALRFRKVNS